MTDSAASWQTLSPSRRSQRGDLVLATEVSNLPPESSMIFDTCNKQSELHQRPVSKHRRRASSDAAMPFPALPKECVGILSHHESFVGIWG